MRRVLIFISLTIVLFVQLAEAQTTKPYSGRRLRSGHWLSCWGGEDVRHRFDPHFHKNSPEEVVARYLPRYEGTYTFEVKDTWEEWVTKYGTDCFRCGETCTGSGNTRSCSCNSCSWQELETFYAPWSTQKVRWKAEYIQDQSYRQKRQDWIAKGKPEVSRTKDDLQKLFEFDPERPLEYFLFPGEVEVITASNNMGFLRSNITLKPTITVEKARHEYKYDTRISLGGQFLCDDRDFEMSTKIYTGKRVISTTPNSIEFRRGWVAATQKGGNVVTEEPGGFELTDVSATRYDQQNKLDHYKNTRVQIWLEHIDRFWWMGDVRVSSRPELKDDASRLKYTDGTEKVPPVGVYTLPGSELYKTRYFGSTFHLQPDEKYQVCSRMIQNNNIYYKTTYWKFFDDWSDENCALFNYLPPERHDQRGALRKTRDFLSKLLGFGLF